MDFIKELGITLLVGAFTILGAEAILHYYFNRGFIGFFEGTLGLEESGKVGKEKEQTMTIAVFIAFAFAVGVVVEDLSWKYRDSKDMPFRTIPAKILPSSLIYRLGLPPELDDQVVTLIGSLQDPDPVPLAVDLANNNAFQISDSSNYLGSTKPIQINDNNAGAKIERWIRNKPRCKPNDAVSDCPNEDEVKNSISNLYYYAKNTVYAHPQHHEELKRIQVRLEFTRSLSMIAVIYSIIALVIGTPLIISRLSHRKEKNKDQTKDQARLHQLRDKIPVVIGTLLVVYFFSLWAFALESEAFNRRAFGYFSTMLISEKRTAKPTGGDQSNENRGGTNSNPPAQATPQATP